MGLFRYLLQYHVRDMADFLRNEKKSPAECGGSLEGKTVVISGATSGIGLETARLFASRGANLVCLNRDPEKSELLEKELGDRFGRRRRTILVDLSSMKQTKECARQLLEMSEPIDVLIHNSGVHYTRKRFLRRRHRNRVPGEPSELLLPELPAEEKGSEGEPGQDTLRELGRPPLRPGRGAS